MITVVSGLPRSGTSLMMQMLHAGGHDILCDDHRQPDPDNPRGYFELDKVRSLERDATWVAEAEGKAIKVISFLLRSLPPGHEYRVIFMHRNLDEVLASQAQMLHRLGQPTGPESTLMRSHFERHLKSITEWISRQNHFRMHTCEFTGVLRSPAAAATAITEFLEAPLRIQDMAAAVDHTLYRQRTQ